MRARDYGHYGLTGLAMGVSMAAVAAYLWLPFTGMRAGPPTTLLCFGIICYGLNVRAWMVRRLVAERREKAEVSV